MPTQTSALPSPPGLTLDHDGGIPRSKGRLRGRGPRGERHHGKNDASINAGSLSCEELQVGKEKHSCRQHNAKKRGSKQKKSSNSPENPSDKTATSNDKNGKRRQRQKAKSQSTERKDHHMNIPNRKIKEALALQRKDEINQCSHLLSERNFKLFKRGQHFSSYGFTRNQKFLGVPNLKFVINIPSDYPRSPLKLQYSKTSTQLSPFLEEELDILTKNFNSKSFDMVSKGVPIISQLNYLVEKSDELCLPDYKVTDRQEQEFYSKFCSVI